MSGFASGFILGVVLTVCAAVIATVLMIKNISRNDDWYGYRKDRKINEEKENYY